jgi:hypothetical protein
MPSPLLQKLGALSTSRTPDLFPAPFLRNAILAEDTFSPLVLVFTGRNAGEEHIRLHSGDEDFDKEDVNNHIELFTLWCMGVHQGLVNETCFSVKSDDGKLESHYRSPPPQKHHGQPCIRLRSTNLHR